MSSNNVQSLPIYPSSHSRKTLSPSQLAGLNQSIAASLLQTIALPPTKRDTPATRNFVSSYAKDNALLTLNGLIWSESSTSKDEKLVKKRALLLAEKLAASKSGLELSTLLDLSIVYAQTNHSRTKSIFSEALKLNPDLIRAVETDLVPAFTQLLSPGQGLYSVRKTAHCIVSFLQSSPPEFVRPFAHNKPFIISLATLYDQGLTSIATSYGGLAALHISGSREPDEWEPIWVQTKVALVDTFHVIITSLLSDLTIASGRALAVESERTFDTIFALLELPQSSASGSSTPFLDRSLLADYQQSYSLSRTLNQALKHAAEKDARLDLLESTLQSLEESTSSVEGPGKNPGAIKILLRSSGISPGMDNRGDGSKVPSTGASQQIGDGRGKGKAPEPAQPSASTSSQVSDLDLKATQVLDILPDQELHYVRALLEHPPYNGNPEKVIEALLDGTAPPQELLSAQRSAVGHPTAPVDDVAQYVNERRNIFDDEIMDVSQLRFGKKKDVTETILRDRSFIEEMKADILRRAEAISEDEEEAEIASGGPLSSATAAAGKAPPRDETAAYDEDEDIIVGGGNLKVGGDGEESDESDADAEGEADEASQNPETILELAYIRDPKLFDRDAATRRSKARAELKERTRWGDEQIEGWKIMLERNPHKDKILAKHEFSGNQPSLPVASSSGQQSRGGGGGRGGRGNRGGGGGSRGGRGRGRGGSSGGDNAKDRAWKDKNKAKQANHDRKRGHDKKLAKMGGPSS